MPDATLLLELHGDDFLLSRTEADGKRSEMVLSEADVIKLAQSAQQLTQAILARRSRPGADAIVLTPVAQIALNVDHHKTEIQLLMIDPHGARIGFLLSPDIARRLVER